MTTFPGSPKLTKGAIVGLDPLNPLASVIIFQYNPKQLSRSLQARTASAEGARSEVLRLSGPPEETIAISELEIDATDELERSDPSPRRWASIRNCRPWRCSSIPRVRW